MKRFSFIFSILLVLFLIIPASASTYIYHPALGAYVWGYEGFGNSNTQYSTDSYYLHFPVNITYSFSVSFGGDPYYGSNSGSAAINLVNTTTGATIGIDYIGKPTSTTHTTTKTISGADGTYKIQLYTSCYGGNDAGITVSSSLANNTTIIDSSASYAIANFTASPTSGSLPLTVQFTDTSIGGPTSWLWDFGDGNTSNVQNPIHVYSTAGQYDIHLTVMNSLHFPTIATRTDYITVNNPGPQYPIANFYASPQSGLLPLSVHFTDTSTGGPTSWLWDFGDGNTSNEQNPLHVYSTAGQYDIHLTVMNSLHFPNIKTRVDYINVTHSNPLYPIVNFDAFPTFGSAPRSVQFTDKTTGSPTSWLWDFGDGSNSTQQNPVHTYSTPGLYSVRLSVLNSIGIPVYKTKEDYINIYSPTINIPIANFVGSPTSGSSPLGVEFTDTSTGVPTSWLWDFGDGTTSTLQDPSHVYSTPGTYNVYLTAHNANGQTIKIRPSYITVSAAVSGIPVANFVGTPTSGHAPFAVQFTDTSTGIPTSWLWDFGDGINSTLQNPLHVYSTAGTYNVYLTTHNANGQTIKIRPSYITVNAATSGIPVADFVGSPTSGTSPLSVQFTDTSSGIPTLWLWDFGDGITSTLQNPLHVYSTAGTYNVYLTARNANGQTIKIRPSYITANAAASGVPIADFTGTPTSGTSPLSVQFYDQSTGVPTSWLWDFGDGTTSTQQNPVHVYSTAGTYNVYLTAHNANGQTIKIRPTYITVTGASSGIPVADFVGSPTSGSSPLSVQFTDTSTGVPTSWLWDFGDNITSTQQNPVHVYSSAGTYNVYLTARNANGQTFRPRPSYITVTSAVSGFPVANFIGSPTSGPAPLAVQFTDTSTGVPTSWLWDFGDETTSAQQNPVHIYSKSGTYNVYLTAVNANGQTVKIRPTYIIVTSGGNDSSTGERPGRKGARDTMDQLEGSVPGLISLVLIRVLMELFKLK